MKALLQAEYGTRVKRVRKLRINLSTAYGLVIGQCTKYLQSRLEGQEKMEMTSNEQDLLDLLKIVKSLLHKHDKDTDYHHVVYHTIFCCFMIFRQGDSINLEYKQSFKEHIEMLESYNRAWYLETARELQHAQLRYLV